MGEAPDDGYARVAGVVHVHTTLSDGGRHARGGDPGGEGHRPRLPRDHRPQQPRREAASRATATACSSWWASELSTPAGHLLGLGLDRDPAWRFNGDGLDGLEDVRDLGGVSFAAHPFSAARRPALERLGPARPVGDRAPERRQRRASAPARACCCRSASTASTPATPSCRASARPTRPSGAGTRCWRGATWSASPARTPTAGCRSRRRGPSGSRPTRPSSPRPATTCSSTGPLTGDAAADRVAVARRLAARPLLPRPRRARPGRRLPLHGGGRPRRALDDGRPRGAAARACAPWPAGECPRDTRVVLLRDGRAVGEGTEALDDGPPRPRRLPGRGSRAGLARAVGDHEPRLRPRRERREAARGRRGAWPGPPPSPREVRPLASLEGSAAFAPEFDPSSWMDTDVARPRGGAGRRRRP